MKRILLFCVAAMVSGAALVAQNVNKIYVPELRADTRQEVVIPDVAGYQVLKGDFHLHTVFSDGDVWPTYRVHEAWKDGLDVIAITDHIEYLPHKKYVGGDLNTPYEIAKPTADKYGLMLIRGTEITRKQGVIGHFNALFIEDANLIPDDDPFVAVQNARKQNAFVLFNHPGWAVDTCLVTEFQQRLFDADMID
ncbi:MAG: PHP domain-containing protein, partial [Bacteroidales bacterium]|nr:PHP domain-containing protein [Bacteroidales bacterium]